MSLLLPKGIVKNSESIESAVGQLDAEPLDGGEIGRLWKVYTTTKRRLQDPTAERLEQFWWRIWGSRRRELKGATVARLFAHISDGPTFVPLRGPPNRDEGAPPLDKSNRYRPGAASTTTLHSPHHNRPSASGKAPAVMPHPILKKTRGPSTTGPRPTARFISPHGSERDSESDTPAGTNSHVVVQPPSPDTEVAKSDRKSSGSSGAAGVKGKSNFVASTAANKKRPVIVRRRSSQATQSGDSSGAATPPTVYEPKQPPKKSLNTSKFQENFSPGPGVSSSTGSRLNKAISKSAEAKSNSKQKSVQKGQSPSSHRSDTGPSNGTHIVEEDQEDMDTASNKAGTPKGPPQQSDSRFDSAPSHVHEKSLNSNERVGIQPRPVRSASDEGAGGAHIMPLGTKGTTSLAPTLTTASGRMNIKGGTSAPTTGRAYASSASRVKGKDSGIDDLFSKQPVPAIAAARPDEQHTGSLARSKSQLTLLLEKDRAKANDNNKSPRKKKH